jgi:ankyrin repeat protein
MSSPNANGQGGAGPAGTARIDTQAGAGPAGTARIDSAGPAGAGGTARIDVSPQAGAGGTARIDAAPQVGAGGTARVDPAAGVGVGGTARVQSTTRAAAPAAGAQGTARVAGAAVAKAAASGADARDSAGDPGDGAAGQHWTAGQRVTLNGVAFEVESALSTTTSEARTYVVRQGAQRFVLKQYRTGLRAPMAALQALRAQPHANVVGIHDHGSEAGQDYELLEYFPAGTLDHLLRHEGPLQDLDRLRRLVGQLADGLEHLHTRVGLIYQDLKPENVLISGADLQRVALADFGISSLCAPGQSEVQVTANGTREYAAPELTRFGNETQTLVTEKVDYFALGITLLECWQGQRPFQGVPDGRRLAQVQDREVPFPPGMDPSLETLIKGLLSPSAKQRFGLLEVRRWVANEALQVDYQATRRVYERLVYRGDESYGNPAELAALLEKYPQLGLDYLYLGTIGKWLEAARDMELATQIEKIVRQFDQDDTQRMAGLRRAIYTLDAARPFVTAGGRACFTSDEIGDAMLAERDHYLRALAQPFEPFYLYLQARGEAEFATEARSRFLGDQPADLAFNQLIYSLHSGGRNRVQIGGQYYFLPEDLADAPADVQDALHEQLVEDHSRVLLWLQSLGIVQELKGLPEASNVDHFSIMQAMPWLRLDEFIGNLDEVQGGMLWDVVRANRLDLLDVFMAQGLDVNAPGEKWKPLVTAAANNRLQAVRYLLDHGADIEVVDGDGDTALAAAVCYRRVEMVELLLSRGARHAYQRPGGGQTVLGLALHPFRTKQNNYPVETAVVQRLLAAGANPNQPGEGGVPALHRALCVPTPEQALELADLLLAHQADPRATGPNIVVDKQPDCAALFIALYALHFQHKGAASYLPVVERLLQAGAPVQALNQGKAPLHWAALWGYEPLVQMLLRAGANRGQVGDDDMLPATYARMRKHHAVEKLLAPRTGLLWKERVASLLVGVFQSVVVALVLIALVGLCYAAMRPRVVLGVTDKWWVYGQLVLLVLAWRLSWLGSWAAVRASLAAPALWGRWLLWLGLGPLALGAAGYLVTGVLHAGLDARKPLAVLAELSPGPLLLALVMSVFTVGFGKRVRTLSGPVKKYLAVGQPVAKARRGRGIVPAVLGAVLAFAVLLKTLAWFGEPEMSTLSPSAPSRQLATLAEAYEVRGSKGQRCSLPKASFVNVLRTVPTSSAGAGKHWAVEVVTVPVGCDGWLNKAEVVVPDALLRFGEGWPGGASPGRSAESTRRAAPAPQTLSVAGVVQGLSSEGWPQINGRSVPLHGVQQVAAAQRARYQSWLAGHENYLSCESVAAGRARCLTRSGIDAAEALLLNGVATAAPNAPTTYQEAMAAAKAAKRGLWKP